MTLRRQGLLADHTQHYGIGCADRCSHKILKGNGKDQGKQLFIKYFLITHRFPLPLPLPRTPDQIPCLCNSIFYPHL